MPSQFSRSAIQKVALYGVDQLNPPTFAGITSVTPNTDGSITANWAAASAPSGCLTPIEYIVYIALGNVNAATLFQNSNICAYVPFGSLTTKVFLLSDFMTYLINGQQYTLGVRAKSATGISENNTGN